MDRQIVYPGQILPETSLLQMTKDAMIGSAKLAAAMLGTSTIANGFAVTPTGPASLQIVVAPGEIYSLANIDSLAFSSLPADTTHSIMKQGIMLDGLTLSCPAPTTTGQSINYLVQATYQDQDSAPVLLPYYNSANPALPFSGMGNNGLTQNTARKGVASVQVKAGASAATGSQVTPAPDSGYVGLYVVTVANGQSTITSSSISQYIAAPLLPSGIVQGVQNGTITYAADSGTANVYAATYTPAVTSLTDGMVLRFKAKNSNTAASTFSPNGLPAKPIVGLSLGALAASSILVNGHCAVCYSLVIDSWILTYSLGAGINWSAISGTPTTVVGYGISDVYTKSQVDTQITSVRTDVTTALGLKADTATTYTKTQTDTLLSVKAASATTLSGYGIALPTQAVAEAGTDNALPMTPLRTTQLVAKRLDAGAYSANSGINITTTGLTGVATLSAATVFVASATGRGTYVPVSVTISLANSGLYGLDTGSPVANTWYYVWAIYNGTTVAAIFSLSSSAPTLPSTYTMSGRMGAVRTGSSAGVLLSTIQVGSTVRYKVAAGTNTTALPLMINGIQGNPAGTTPSLVTAAISSVVPPTAVKIGLSLAGYCATTSAIAAPNNAYIGVPTGATQASPLSISQGSASSTQLSATGDFVIESGNVYYASSASPSGLSCTGWEDSI